ncbi:MAG: hypothetical protein FWG98_03985 [Candidatus Cloacimonetes bacterium]|nr:hypothetical protein [Candidatus Cloacimonadota bacterium]
MKNKNIFWYILVFLIIIFTSCSESKITELEETAINISDIGDSLHWDSFVVNHDYHLSFSYDENNGWSAHLLGYKWETKPTATLKINNQKIDIEWYSPFSRDAILPPWHQGNISIAGLGLQSGEEISIELESSKGVSYFRFRLPVDKPQIVDIPSIYKPDEDFYFNWELFQIADFQAVSVSVHEDIGDIYYGYFRSLSEGIRKHIIPANTLIEKEYAEHFDLNIGVYNMSAKSAGNQTYIITAMKADIKWLQIFTE